MACRHACDRKIVPSHAGLGYSGSDFFNLRGMRPVVAISIISFVTIFAVSIIWATRPEHTDHHPRH
jgi:hypothetical protein